MTTPIDQKNAISLAVLETEFQHLKTGLADVKFSNARQTEKIDEILQAMHEARGSWRALMLIGGAAGSMGGLVTWAVAHWKG